jgi:hypothetical protein
MGNRRKRDVAGPASRSQPVIERHLYYDFWPNCYERYHQPGWSDTYWGRLDGNDRTGQQTDRNSPMNDGVDE